MGARQQCARGARPAREGAAPVPVLVAVLAAAALLLSSALPASAATTGNVCSSSVDSPECRACTDRVLFDIGEDCGKFETFFTEMGCSCSCDSTTVCQSRDFSDSTEFSGCSCELSAFTLKGILAMIGTGLLLVATICFCCLYCRTGEDEVNEIIVNQPAGLVQAPSGVAAGGGGGSAEGVYEDNPAEMWEGSSAAASYEMSNVVYHSVAHEPGGMKDDLARPEDGPGAAGEGAVEYQPEGKRK